MKNLEKKAAVKLDDALAIVMKSAHRLGAERVAIERALNRVLAEDVVSDIDVPPFNKSAMDGYACRRSDLPNELVVVETIRAGVAPTKAIGPNECAKIMTGAVVPEGADCVIMVEYTRVTAKDKIRFDADNTKKNICWKGEDVKTGDIVLRAGRIIKPQHIAVLATHGCVEPLVSLRPRVGIIATGSELVEADSVPESFQIRNSNGFQLAAQVAGMGAVATNYGIAVDTEEAIGGMVTGALLENDVVILSGGVSMGDYDLVPDILRKSNVELLFQKVAIKPGRPTVFGVFVDEEKNSKHIIGLPGNPVSSFVVFELLVKPFLYKMMGHDFNPGFSYGQLKNVIRRRNIERDSWLPVMFADDGKVRKLEYHGSAHINALCDADGLICVPAGVAQVRKDTTVAVRQI